MDCFKPVNSMKDIACEFTLDAFKKKVFFRKFTFFF